MIYPGNFEYKTGFDSIKNRLKELCLSEAGQLKTEQIRFSDSIRFVENQLALTSEFCSVLTSAEKFPSQDYYYLAPELERITLAGAFIELEKMAELRLSYTTIEEIVDFFYKEQELYPLLFA